MKKCIRVLIFLLVLVEGEDTFSQGFTQVQPVSSILCGPIPPFCYPMPSGFCCGLGIKNVLLNQIDNDSNCTTGYCDFTCSDSTFLIPGVYYTMRVTTGFIYIESVIAWIDLNNDSDFDSTEIVFKDSAVLTNHIDSFAISTSVIYYYTSLRMRIASDISNNPFPMPCSSLYGNFEDFTIYFLPASAIPLNENKYHISIFPNPTEGDITVRMDLINTSNVSLEHFDLLGKKTKSYFQKTRMHEGLQTFTITDCPPGVNFLRFTINEDVFYKRILRVQ